MTKKLRALMCVTAATAMAAAFAPGAYAGVEEPPPCDPKTQVCEPPPPPPPATKSKCNSGNGNGSDAVTFVVGEHCYGGDPGKSFAAGNKGGDEVPPGEPNPGGNNVAP